MSYATDVRNENRLTPNQVDALNILSGYEDGEVSAYGLAHLTSPRTVASLVRRGLVSGSGSLTPLGRDVLYAYI